MEIAAEGGGLTSVTRFLGYLTELPVILCDLTLRILAYQLPAGSKYYFGDYLPLDLPIQAETRGEFYLGKLKEPGIDYLMLPIGREPRYGYLFLLEAGKNWEVYQEPLKAAALAAMVEMSRTRISQETERRYRNEFVQDILYNNIPNREAMVNRGRLWGWDLTRPHLLVVMELDDREKKEGSKMLWDQWHQLVRYHLGRQVSQVILADRSEQLIILLPVGLDDLGSNKRKLTNLVNYLQKTTAEHLAGITFSAGVGRFYENVAELYRAYQEAKVALEISRLLCRRDALTFFDELGVLRLIFNLGEQELEDYYEENLGPLEKYDKEHNTNLLETLAVYLYASGDYNQAAMNMFVHVNTLRYRLKKVEEILGQDLRQLAVLVNLYTALQVKVMLGR
jgi:sugar diacid utilization regulator